MCQNQGRAQVKGNMPLSYTIAGEHILKAVEAIGLNTKLYGLHSFRRGGATYSARLGVKNRLFKNHGRWRSENAKDGYVADSLEEILSVPKYLGICIHVTTSTEYKYFMFG